MQWTDLRAVSSSTSLIRNCPQEELKADALNAQHKVEKDFMHVKTEAGSCQYCVLFSPLHSQLSPSKPF